MAGEREYHTAAFKAQVALAALKADRTVNRRASQYGVHPTLVHGWKHAVPATLIHGGAPVPPRPLPGVPRRMACRQVPGGGTRPPAARRAAERGRLETHVRGEPR